MTVQPQNAFKCDRCDDVATLPIANTPARAAPPEGWVTLWINDTTKPANHLCPPCAFGMSAYMQDKTLKVG
jgi:hypothetical protein